MDALWCTKHGASSRLRSSGHCLSRRYTRTYLRICNTPIMLSMLPSYTGRRLWRCSRMNERIFSGGVFTSSAATSTRGVNTRSTVTSPNSSAEWTSSARSSGSSPSSVIVSMMSYSSSSVTVISGSPLAREEKNSPMRESAFASGAKMRIKKHRDGAVARAHRSL